MSDLLPPGAAYRMTNPTLVCDTRMIRAYHQVFPPQDRSELFESLETFLHVDGRPPDHARFDGSVLIPRIDEHDYDAWLRRLMESCRTILASCGFDLVAYVAGRPAHVFRLQPNACANYSARFLLTHFQLGFRYLSVSPEEAAEKMRAANEQPLEPGVALIILTLLAMQGGLKSPMRIDCPGVLYSPRANGKFEDSLRWDVQPPYPGVRGIIALDWNWKTRARALHGVASGVVIPEK